MGLVYATSGKLAVSKHGNDTLCMSLSHLDPIIFPDIADLYFKNFTISSEIKVGFRNKFGMTKILQYFSLIKEKVVISGL